MHVPTGRLRLQSLELGDVRDLPGAGRGARSDAHAPCRSGRTRGDRPECDSEHAMMRSGVRGLTRAGYGWSEGSCPVETASR